MENKLTILITHIKSYEVNSYGQPVPLKQPKVLVGHGIELNTHRIIALQQEPISWYETHYNAYFDEDMGEWVMPSNFAKKEK